MDADELYIRHLRRLKWTLLGTVLLVLGALEFRHYVTGNMSLIEVLVDWVLGVALAIVLAQVALGHVTRLQNHLRTEIAERANLPEHPADGPQ